MALDTAEHLAIDPQATGSDAVRAAFENQVAYCSANDAPVTAAVCQAVLDLLAGTRGGPVMARIRGWDGPPLADALPLRIAGGLHALHLAGTDPRLAPIYAGAHAPRDTAERVAAALVDHAALLLPWLDGPPQTNEASRSWAFAAAMLWLVEQGLPARFALFEFGSSAGINLMMDRYRFDLAGVTAGPRAAAMHIAPQWHGKPPPAREYEIMSAEGCDVAPVDLTDAAQALRLRAYIWPEHAGRFARMDAAIEAARERPPHIVHQAAGEFVSSVRGRPAIPGVTRMIMHSVVWQYIPAVERKAVTSAIEAAAAEARADAPLAWVMLEANRDTHQHELTVRYWPGGGEPVRLAVAHPHGNWVKWEMPK